MLLKIPSPRRAMVLSYGKDCHCKEPEATKQSLCLQEIASLLTVARNDAVA